MTAVAFSPDGQLLALTSGNGDVRLVDVRTGDTKIAAGAHGGGAHAVAFDPSGRTIATGGADRLIRVWRVPSLQPVRVLRPAPVDAFRRPGVRRGVHARRPDARRPADGWHGALFDAYH